MPLYLLRMKLATLDQGTTYICCCDTGRRSSVAVFVPVRRALAWQSTDPAGTPVVRERYWITMQPGEIRVCDGCHGVNTLNQAGQPPAQNTATAFRELLHDVKDAVDFIFDDGFGD